jgi:predicted O-linked N-acetylglucosamine transferase (SPINDLY family)
MSSDLRDHPVSYFTAPLLERYDRSRFEIYTYSWFNGAIDAVQTRLAGLVDAFRHAPAMSDRDAAQLIADDNLDMLFELGGSTHMNKLKVMTWKPAPRQASWLGYPHSAGHAAIDRLLLDPYTRPADPALILEKPFGLAHSWVAFDKMGFGPVPDIDPVTPQERTGQITFGTMNNPFKFNPDMLATWAAVMSRVPGSRLLLKAAAMAQPSNRESIERFMAVRGIAPDRLTLQPWIAGKSTHLEMYNGIDVALDTFPYNGATTTCEALWMGVPTLTLALPGMLGRQGQHSRQKEKQSIC